MAIAESIIGGHLLSKFRIKGLHPIAVATGVGIGIGTYLYENWELFNPTGGNILMLPGKGKQGTPFLNGSSQKNASTYQRKQALRTLYKCYSRHKRGKKSSNCRQCCCSCN